MTWRSDLIVRWNVGLRITPVVVGLVLLRWSLFSNSIVGWFDQSLVSTFCSSATFVLSIMLSGVIRDYNEAERMPSEIGAAFAALRTSTLVQARLKGFDPSPGIKIIENMFLAVLDYIDQTSSFEDTTQRVAQAEIDLCCLIDSNKGVFTHIVPAQVVFLHQRLARINVIRNTTFIPPGYTLMDLITFASLFMLQTCKFAAGPHMALLNVGIYSTFFLYLNLLLRDLDNPFDYPPGFNRQCYESGRLPDDPPLKEVFRHGSSIPFGLLSVSYGRDLLLQLHPDAAAKSYQSEQSPLLAR